MVRILFVVILMLFSCSYSNVRRVEESKQHEQTVLFDYSFDSLFYHTDSIRIEQVDASCFDIGRMWVVENENIKVFRCIKSDSLIFAVGQTKDAVGLAINYFNWVFAYNDSIFYFHCLNNSSQSLIKVSNKFYFLGVDFDNEFYHERNFDSIPYIVNLIDLSIGDTVAHFKYFDLSGLPVNSSLWYVQSK